MRDFFLNIWVSFKHLFAGLWKWLTFGLEDSFWGSRLFWVCGIALALLALVVFIICKKASNEHKRLRKAAIDRLRDDSLISAITKKKSEEDEKTEKISGPFLLHQHRRTYRRNFIQVIEHSELSHRELIFCTEDNITIGRNESCSISMRDRYAAAAHAVIFREGRKLYLQAKQNDQPTYLKHLFRIRQLEASKPHRLRSGDTFQIGISHFQVKVFNCRIPGGYL